MSKKHNQRTRAEILAKRAKPIDPKSLIRHTRSRHPVSTPHAMVRKASRSKYVPHFGAKQRTKLRGSYLA